MRIRVSDPKMIWLGVILAAGIGVGSWTSGRTRAGLFALGEQALGRPMLLAAIASSLLWFGLIGLARVVNQPRRPPRGAATQDLGPEPPAIAAMLVDNFEVPREAAAATLLDLAARGAVEITETGDEEYEVRLRAEPPDVAEHERLVLMLLRQRAVDGAVPAAALSAGSREIADRWWKGFRKAVTNAARGRGLSRDLWGAGTMTLLGAAAVIPAAAWGLAAREWEPAAGAGFAAFAILGAIRTRGRQRETPAGLQAASRWHGVRRWTRQAAFDHLPPTAVTIWERHMAYAAAFGVARQALRAFPMGADDDHEAWTPREGDWVKVKIRYPYLFPPGWGLRPAIAALAGFGAMVLSFFPLRLASLIGWPQEDPLLQGLSTFLLILMLASLSVGLVAAAGGLISFVGGLTDLGSERPVEGLVLRMRTFGKNERRYVAVDDGRSNRIWAWRVRPEAVSGGGLAEYRRASAVVTRTLRHVRSISPASAAD